MSPVRDATWNVARYHRQNASVARHEHAESVHTAALIGLAGGE